MRAQVTFYQDPWTIGTRLAHALLARMGKLAPDDPVEVIRDTSTVVLSEGESDLVKEGAPG